MNANQEIQEMEFVHLDSHQDYEISTTILFVIRRRKDGNILKQSMNNVGYLQINLNSETIPFHRIIAKQFIPNPDNLPDVDHKNHIKLDNRLENLEWVPHSENFKRRAKYNHQLAEYLDSLDGLNIIPLTDYNNVKFDRYFFDKDNEKLYLKTRAKKKKQRWFT